MTSLLAGQSTLYGSSRSPFARRVRLALLSRSIPFQWKELSLSEIFPPSPELLRVNPMGLIPAFESSTGLCLGDSNEILSFLDENVGGLWHSEAEMRVRHKRVSSMAQGIMTYAVREFQGLRVVSPDGKYHEDNTALIKRVLSAIELSLSELSIKENKMNLLEVLCEGLSNKKGLDNSVSQAAWDLGVALDYIDFRLHEKFRWRQYGYALISQLYECLSSKLMFVETKPM
jgi:hypothetical protein